MKRRILFIAACAGGLLSGTAQWATAQQMPSGEEAASSASAQDTKLEKKIDHRLQHDQKLKARNVDASVTDGVVTLTGMVRSSSEKSRAEKLARTKGVSEVDNQIEIEGQASTPSAPQGTAQPSGEEPQAQPPSEGNVRERTTKVEERTETRTERVPQPSNQQQQGQPSSAPSDEAVPQPAPPAEPAPPSTPAPAPRSNVPQQ